MDVDDYTQPLEAVMREERAHTWPVPLTAASYRELFAAWAEANPKALHEMEMTALAIHARGMRVSAKYLIERQRYEGRSELAAVPYTDQYGNVHRYRINNTITPLLGRWLLERNPEMRVYTSKSMFDEKEGR